jgi:hypothetical protein
MKKLELAKTAISTAVAFGVGAIASNVIKSTTPIDVKKITKLCIGFGGFILTSMAGDAASKYTEGKIDEYVNMIKSFFNPNMAVEEKEEDDIE